MCCYSDPKAKREFLAKLGRRKTFTAWKALWRHQGLLQSVTVGMEFRPGVNTTTQHRRYNTCHPTGFHVYEDACNAEGLCTDGDVVVPVVCRRDDVWRVSRQGEIVVRNQIIIRKKEYERAISQ